MNFKILIPLILFSVILGVTLFLTVFSNQPSVSKEATEQSLTEILSSAEFKKHDKMKGNKTSKNVLTNDQKIKPKYLNIREITLEHDNKGVGRITIFLDAPIPSEQKEYTLMYGVEITDLKNPKTFYYSANAYKVMKSPMYFSLELPNLVKSKDTYFKGFSKDNVIVMNFRISKLAKKDKVNVRILSFATEGITSKSKFFTVNNNLK